MQIQEDAERAMRALVAMALKEDIGRGDVTSLGALDPDRVSARIVAKSEGILSGVEPARLVFATVDEATKVTFAFNDSDLFKPGDVIAHIDGYNQTILAAERVALNFLGHLSGIATLTFAFVQRLGDSPVRILDTRKTTPGWRYLEKAAVAHGGGANHRMGLYDMVLIKDNHIAAAGSVTHAVERVRHYLGSPIFRQQFECSPDEIDIEVEVTDEAQAIEAIDAGAHRLLLDNQTIESLTSLVVAARKRDPSVILEASGNVTLETVAQIAACGVDYISAGALTHSAPGSDFSLQITGLAS